MVISEPCQICPHPLERREGMKITTFKSYWYCFWGTLVGRLMLRFDIGCLYGLYHKLMSTSVDFDKEYRVWK
jgi:hypothetical protein